MHKSQHQFSCGSRLRVSLQMRCQTGSPMSFDQRWTTTLLTSPPLGGCSKNKPNVHITPVMSPISPQFQRLHTARSAAHLRAWRRCRHARHQTCLRIKRDPSRHQGCAGRGALRQISSARLQSAVPPQSMFLAVPPTGARGKTATSSHRSHCHEA
jgi:hypothetical protein